MVNLRKTFLFLGDIFLLYFSLFLSLYLRFLGNLNWETFVKHLFPFSVLFFFWLVIFYIFELYSPSPLNFFLFFRISFSLFLAFAFSVILFYFISFFGIAPKRILVLVILIFGILAFLWRMLFNFLFSAYFLKNTIILGENPEIKKLKNEIFKKSHLGFKILPNTELKKENFEVLVFPEKMESDKDFLKIIDRFLPKKVIFLPFSEIYELVFEKIPVSSISKIWFLKNLKEGEKKIYDKIKRFFDIVFAFFILILTLPIWLLIILTIKIEDKGPVFYLQERVGKNKKIFNLIKFRSMIPDAEKNGPQWAKKEDSRTTKIGKILRRTHLDELPQMLNILKGDISLIGPRPERPEFVHQLEKEISHYHIRHLIKPGFTGWAQIKFRYGRSVEDSLEKFQYDLFYIKNRSLILDLRILLKTLKLLFKKE